MTDRCSIDLSWVTPQLAVGASFRAVQIGELRDCSIRRVVDLREEACDDPGLLERHGARLLHLPTPDLCAICDDAIARGVAWVNDGLDRGERTLVHCEHGIGRSASLACCVLISRGMPIDEALAALKRGRPRVSPSPEQLVSLLAWARRRGAAPAALRWSDLAAIIYPAAA